MSTGYFKLHAANLINAGYPVVPIKTGTKRPSVKTWQNANFLASDANKYGNDGLGVLCGVGAAPVCAFDLDCSNKVVLRGMLAWCARELGATCERVGDAPRVLLSYRAAEAGWSKASSKGFFDAGDPVKSSGKKNVQKLEVLGKGQQFVAYARHPDTGRDYEWVDDFGGLLAWPASELLVVTWEQVGAAIAEFDRLCSLEEGLVVEGDVKEVSTGVAEVAEVAEVVEIAEVDLTRLTAALAAIPDSKVASMSGYSDWMNFVFSIHHESRGSDAGLELAHAFCKRMPNYDADEIIRKWEDGIKGTGGEKNGLRTAGWLLGLAKESGWVEDVTGDFEVVGVAAAGNGINGAPELPKFQRNKAGEFLATLNNVVLALESHEYCGISLRFDTFRDEVAVHFAEDSGEKWHPLRDTDYIRMRRHLETNNFREVTSERIRDAVRLVAKNNEFDAAQEWLYGLKWDGIKRIDNFLECYFAAESDEYTKAVGAYLWTALAGRIVSPGCQADMVPILVGAQGIKKSSIAAAMVPETDFFTEIDLNERDADMSRRMRGTLIGEISELRGLNSRDMESIKAFITRRVEKWVPKFFEHAIAFKRRLIFIGTTNKDEFLADSTGERRWLPVKVQQGDVAALEADRDQLWSEGLARYIANGIEWQAAERLAKDSRSEHTLQDGWVEFINEWSEQEEDWSDDMNDPDCKKLRGESGFTFNEMLTNCLRLSPRDITPAVKDRARNALKAAGFLGKTIRRGKEKPVWGWKKGKA